MVLGVLEGTGRPFFFFGGGGGSSLKGIEFVKVLDNFGGLKGWSPT